MVAAPVDADALAIRVRPRGAARSGSSPRIVIVRSSRSNLLAAEVREWRGRRYWPRTSAAEAGVRSVEVQQTDSPGPSLLKACTKSRRHDTKRSRRQLSGSRSEPPACARARRTRRRDRDGRADRRRVPGPRTGTSSRSADRGRRGRATAITCPLSPPPCRSPGIVYGDGIRRAPLPLSVFVPRRRLAARGARRPGGRPRLRGARAHRSRRRLRLARVCARGQGVRRPAGHRRGADLRGGAHVTVLVETPKGYANLCRLLTDAHAGTRPKEGAEPLPPELPLDRLLEQGDGLVCLSGCARHGLGVRDPNAAALVAAAFEDRFYVELQRPYERGTPAERRPSRARPRPRRPHGCNRRCSRSPRAPQRPPRRARRDPLPHVAGRLRAGAARKSRVGSARSGGDDRAVLRRPGRGSPDRRDRRRPDVRPDGGAGLPVPRLLGRLRKPRRAAARRVPEGVEDRYRTSRYRNRAKARLRDELALISELRLSGFFLLHWEVLELARVVAAEVRGPGSPRHALPPGRGRAARSDRSSAT